MVVNHSQFLRRPQIAKTPQKVFVWIAIVFWIAWCVLIVCHKYSKIRFLKLWNQESLYTAVLLICPLAIVCLTAIILGRLQNKKIMRIAMAVGVVLFYIVLNVFSFIIAFVPVVSTTEALDNYLLPDRDRQLPMEVVNTFPERPAQGDHYRYYRKEAWSKADSDSCFVLAHYANAEEIKAEKERLSSISFLHAARETWDGFRQKEWSGYQIFVGEVSSSKTGYIWVLLPEDDGYILYYYRPYSNAEDKLLSVFYKCLKK